MGWEEDLFGLLDDLEGQAEALYDVERDAELADRSRSAYHEVTLASRLAASVGDGAGIEVGIEVEGVGLLTGTVERVATGWLLLHGPAQDWVLRLDAVRAVHGASARSVPEVAWPAVSRLGLASALRRLADAGERCGWHLRDGTRHDGVPVRVGADFVEVTTARGRTVLVSLAALAGVQSRPDGRG